MPTTKKKPAKKPVAGKKSGADEVRHDLAHWFDLAGPEIVATGKAALKPPHAGRNNYTYEWDQVDKPPTPAKGKGQGKGEGSSTAKLTPAELQKLEYQEIEANPFTQMGNDLAAAQEQETNAALSYLTPAAQANASTGAQNQALADVGMKSSPWLSGEVAQANANDSPMAAAMQAYTNAYEATEPSITSAIQGMGEANALAEQVAPADPYLNLASSHLGTTNYLQLNPAQAANLPPALQYYLGPKGAGVSGVTGPGTAALPSAGAVLSGATASGTPSAVAPGTGTAPG